MQPSSKALEEAIDRLKASPGTFQRLVEGYAEVMWPDRFGGLAPVGRRSDDVVATRWPDALRLGADGRLVYLEATHSEQWKRHLEEDLAKAAEREPGSIGAFLFVAWAKTPPDDDLLIFQRRLVALGIAAAQIELVFRERLVRELGHPRYARLWIDPLGLPATCEPFEWLDRTIRLFGAEDRPSVFAPSRSEYLAGRVYRPGLADLVEERLTSRGWALVRGLGAAGKTVLALSIGLGPGYKSRPVYYLDLTDWGGGDATEESAQEALASRGDDGVLFIVDNVHLDPRTARRIFDGWQNYAGNGSRLLLIGRFATPEPDHRGRVDPLADLEPDALILQVDRAALLGVSRRLASRIVPPGEFVDPEEGVLDNWLKTFGGDLLAFSTATTARAHALIRGEWRLEAGDARRYVEQEYVDGRSDEEKTALLRLAVLAEVEVPATAACLGTARLAGLLVTGLVLRSEHGRERWTRYRLVHPGMGPLLLSAMPWVDRHSILRQLARSDPFVTTFCAHRLRVNNRLQEAKLVLEALLEVEPWDSTPFTAGYLERTVKLFADLGVASEGELLIKAAARPGFGEAWVDSALCIPIHFLATFLSFAKGVEGKGGPALFSTITQALLLPNNLKALVESALRTSLGDLAAFLRFTQQVETSKGPALFSAVTSALLLSGNRQALVDSALRTPLGFLADFLRLAQRVEANRGPALFSIVTQALLLPDNRTALVDSALRTPLGDLATFLRFTQQVETSKGPALFSAVTSDLFLSGNRQALIDSALRTSLGSLAAFFRFGKEIVLDGQDFSFLASAVFRPENLEQLVRRATEEPLGSFAAIIAELSNYNPKLHLLFVEALRQPAVCHRLAVRLAESPLSEISSFLAVPDLAAAVVDMVDEEDWNTKWALRTVPELQGLGAVISRLTRLDRRELAKAPARRAIELADPSEWHQPHVSFYNFSHAVRAAGELASEVVAKFLNRVATETWLLTNFRRGRPGVVAGALFSLGLSLHRDNHTRFAVPRLSGEVERKLRRGLVQGETTLSDLIGLLGAGALLGMRFHRVWLHRLREADLRKALAERGAFDPEAAPQGSLPAQLWVGIRELAFLRSPSWRVDASFVKAGRLVWQAFVPERESSRRLQAHMLAWLDACERSGWTLLPGKDPWIEVFGPLPEQ